MQRQTYKAQGVKPCPFCGSTKINVIVLTFGMAGNASSVSHLECRRCRAVVSFVGNETVSQVSEMWNRRAERSEDGEKKIH